MSPLKFKKSFLFFIYRLLFHLYKKNYYIKQIYFKPYQIRSQKKNQSIILKMIIGCWGLVFFQSGYALCSGTNCACSVEVMPVNFGNYSSFSVEPTTGLGKITVNCTAQTSGQISYKILLNTGGGNFSSRTMSLGSKKLQYNLYLDSAYQLIWGDGSVGTNVVNDGYTLIPGNNTKTYPVFGRILASQRLPVGVYSDIIAITIDY